MSIHRVVITGLGIVSPIGNNAAEVTKSLRAGRSGISAEPKYTEHGFRCQVAGIPDITLEDHIEKRQMRFMGPGAAYNYLAMEQAIRDSRITTTAATSLLNDARTAHHLMDNLLEAARVCYADTDPALAPVATMVDLVGCGAPGPVGFGTEAGLYTDRLGVPSVIVGPGDIADAHRPDEYVAPDQLERCGDLLRRTIHQFCSDDSPTVTERGNPR